MGLRQSTRRLRSDAELLTAHVAGDRRAFAELFARHHRRLYRLAKLISLNAEDAEDALQEAMLSAHRGAASFRRNAQVSSWLHRIVLNACLDRLRRAKAQPAVPLRWDYPVADRTTQSDTAIVVQRALMRLPVEQRAVVVAVDMHGYSIAETAALLGVAEGTVKSRCSRARARLARLLGYLDAGDSTSRALRAPNRA
ncbi:RNA polymerase sigma factor SigM [Mycobacterium vicinigordonae]|uniref:RNA polymerase sigma factor SigM n=1 Tax=Mycobacterium vicinigordonae TaxID=1719132 RepID=A0A7D6HUZ9_9MYCO|nr:RNA polymerase sigma factor SigM [Mycobacterium vicinigordonae]QLL07453.1 RNA polymerase sigma factor SigM [Mycobacterium vicinigordonae]